MECTDKFIAANQIPCDLFQKSKIANALSKCSRVTTEREINSQYTLCLKGMNLPKTLKEESTQKNHYKENHTSLLLTHCCDMRASNTLIR